MPNNPNAPENISFTVRTGASDNGDSFLLEGIPADVWSTFQEKTAEALPEHGSNAWSVYICNAITALCDGDTSTFILTDIPKEAADRLKEAASVIQATPEEMIANLFATAMANKFHSIRFTPPPNDPTSNDLGHTIMLFNLPVYLWDAWDKAAKDVGLTPHVLFGQMFEAAHGGDFSLTRRDIPEQEPDTDNAPNTPQPAGE